ncbi:iron-sulfur cluster assembly scaffold protein [Holospora undulata]|uniref:Iron-sulfur cluster assembly enzyme ISCU, mitochondrial n=1 Tax=Holospora undulata HU1 TaxID=1321371 RepID=A0A061JGB8_9PROT|nr:iron-sulfur cluster assembly scaffold protein [Holospora undulata]ETZ05041.1 iron-sulfur cluster assembly enzyme ISCU, mitochondrial [Holospora undulata HU1]
MAYNKKILDHYENPQNVGVLEDGPNVGTGMVGAPACGDVMKLQIQVDENGKIVKARFKAFGCGSAIASASYAASMLEGMQVSEAKKISNTVIANELGLPPVKLHCSMLAQDAIEAALEDLKNKKNNK